LDDSGVIKLERGGVNIKLLRFRVKHGMTKGEFEALNYCHSELDSESLILGFIISFITQL
jgi:hypothetical protein